MPALSVYLPFTVLQEPVLAALDAAGWPYEAVDVSGDDGAYYRLLAALWAEQRSFCIIEHDVVIGRNTLAELQNCPQPWCSFAVPYMEGHYAGMACVKFDSVMIADVPHALQRVGQMFDPTHPREHWCRLDAWLQITLQQAGYHRHVHDPPLEHLRPYEGKPYPAHGCIKES